MQLSMAICTVADTYTARGTRQTARGAWQMAHARTHVFEYLGERKREEPEYL